VHIRESWLAFRQFNMKQTNPVMEQITEPSLHRSRLKYAGALRLLELRILILRAAALQKAPSRCLPPPHHDCAHALDQFISKVVVRFTFFTQRSSMEENGFGWLQSPRVKMPVIGRKQPRPA
jgi:hypothetical protein